jgi:hypothetical protein
MIKIDGQIDFQDGKGVFSHMHIAERTGFTLRIEKALEQKTGKPEYYPLRMAERIETNDFREKKN